MPSNVLIIDDEAMVRQLLRLMIEEKGYICDEAGSGKQARKMFDRQPYELVLCDINLPDESGLKVAQDMLASHPDSAVVMITALNDTKVADEALSIGAYDFVIKPFNRSRVVISVTNALRRRELEIANRKYRYDLEKMVSERTTALSESMQQLRQSLKGIIHATAMTVEMRDPYTAGHQRQVVELAVKIGQELEYTADELEGLRMGGVIHDIGKVAIPAEILSKPARLTEIEFALMKTHSQIGFDILKDIEFPWPVAQIIRQHHERLDGSGYPDGLRGDQILKEARVLCVADVMDAMASHRPYRSALGIEAAIEEIKLQRGRRYDAHVVDACLRLYRQGDIHFN